MNNIIINPEDNQEWALMIWNDFKNYMPEIPVIRDNCIDINKDLFNKLLIEGYPAKLINGYFKVDSLINLFDENDFTDAELKYILSKYGNTEVDSLNKYISNLNSNEQLLYYYIPHVYITVDELIIDGASDMFNKYISKLTKFKYFDEDLKPIME